MSYILDVLGRFTENRVLAVMADNEGQGGLVDGDTGLPLLVASALVSQTCRIYRRGSLLFYLSAKDVLILDSEGHIALAGGIDAFRESFDYRRVVLVAIGSEEGTDRNPFFL